MNNLCKLSLPWCKCRNSPKAHGALTENKEETFLPPTCMKPQHVVYSVAALKMEGGRPREKPRTASTVMAVWVWPLVDGFWGGPSRTPAPLASAQGLQAAWPETPRCGPRWTQAEPGYGGLG